jgi:hypothetical protein
MMFSTFEASLAPAPRGTSHGKLRNDGRLRLFKVAHFEKPFSKVINKALSNSINERCAVNFFGDAKPPCHSASN